MKKFSRFATILTLVALFTSPLITSAQFDYACNPPCLAGTYCNSSNVCVSISQTLTQVQSGGINIGVIKPYSDSIIGIINGILVPVLMAIAFIVFLFGIYKYFIYGASNESDKAEGRKFAMWGIIGFVIIISVWGLVSIVSGAFGLQPGGSAPKPPTF